MTEVNISCGECGIQFSVPKHWQEERRADHRGWYCPNGHCRAYKSESDEERFRRERDKLKQRIAEKDDEIAEANAATAKIERKMKRLATKGVCPCCARSFLNVKRHMATKHADFMCDNPKPALKVVK